MKKLFALLLAVMLLIFLTACGDKDKKADDKKETEAAGTTGQTGTEAEGTIGQTAQTNKITIYLPKTETTSYVTTEYTYEEGWQEKDTFTVTYESAASGSNVKTTMTISDKKIVSVSEYNGTTSTSEIYYDENGRVIKRISPVIPAYDSVEFPVTEGKYETVNTYDEKGRLVKVEENYYPLDGQEPSTRTVNYTYTDTAEGSEGRYDLNYTDELPDDPLLVQPSRKVLVYNKDNWLIKEIILMGEQEINRTEYTYNECGIQTSMSYYANGELNFTMNTTLEAVAVSPEKAAMLPWAK